MRLLVEAFLILNHLNTSRGLKKEKKMKYVYLQILPQIFTDHFADQIHINVYLHGHLIFDV